MSMTKLSHSLSFFPLSVGIDSDGFFPSLFFCLLPLHPLGLFLFISNPDSERSKSTILWLASSRSQSTFSPDGTSSQRFRSSSLCSPPFPFIPQTHISHSFLFFLFGANPIHRDFLSLAPKQKKNPEKKNKNRG
jgi:hypothetical protein